LAVVAETWSPAEIEKPYEIRC